MLSRPAALAVSTERTGERREEIRQKIVRALEEIAFEPGSGAKIPERMKAMELLGKLMGLWDSGPEERIAGELSRLAELLEQRRQRGGGP